MIGKVILGLGSLAGGSLAVWRLSQEVVEIRKLGPPAWLAMLLHPAGKNVEFPPKGRQVESLAATRVFRWDRDRWVPLTPFVYSTPIAPSASRRVCVEGEPRGRLLYAQVWWTRSLAEGSWRSKKVQYASKALDKLPR